jgi:hypothetical protein
MDPKMSLAIFRLAHSCAALLVLALPTPPCLAYDGPIVDVHMHWFGTQNVSAVRDQAAKNNVPKIVVFPRMFGPDRITEEAATQLARSQSDLFWVFIGLQKNELTGTGGRRGNAWDWHRPPAEWKSFLAWARGELMSGRRHGLGELTARHYDYKGNDGGERDLPLDSALFADLLRLSAETKRPLVLHAEAEQHVMAALEKQLAENPAALVIWAHACGRTLPDQARRVLARFPNLYCDLANMTDQGRYGSLWPRAGPWTSQFEKSGKIVPEWRDVVVEFPRRFMIGMDINEQRAWNDGQWNVRLRRFRALLDQLPGDVASAVAADNALRLFGSRP